MKARGGGSFLVTTSIAASHPLEGLGIYSTTKAALVMMVKVLALELAPHAIRVNALAPGVIDTKFSSALLADDDMRRHAVAEVPLGRIGLPHDIAGTAVFLASDASAFVTGQTLVIDGGQTL
jgi:dehydrogenase/reductase SDR family protein 4